MRRWSVLLAGTFVLAAQAGAISGLAVLAPEFRDHYDLSLTEIGVLLGVSSIGALLTLLAWGLAADRIGERTTAAIGMLGASAALAAAAYATAFASLVALLFLMAAFAASANTATARAVTSWFARSERGFALGVRQTAVPLGGFAAALALPAIDDAWGLRTAMLVIAGAVLVAAIVAAALMVEGPIRTVDDEADALRHPVRDRRIWRIASGSSLLLVTQIVLTGFVVLFLESQRGFSHGAAGAVLAGMNVVAIDGAARRRPALRSPRLQDRAHSSDRGRHRRHRRNLGGAGRRPELAALRRARPRRRPVDELERPRCRGDRGNRRARPVGCRPRGPADDAPDGCRARATRLRAVHQRDVVGRGVRGRSALPAGGRLRAAARPGLSDNRPVERVLMLAGDAVEDLEIYYILYRLREAGYAVDVAAPTRRTMRTVVHDFEPDSDAYVERPGRRLEPDLAFSEVEPERYVGVVIPGGRAPEYIRVDPDVKRIVSHFFDNDLPVGTLCHGPQVPAALGYLQGRKSSGFPPLAPDIEAAGGTYVEGPDVVDGNMVSCTGWPDLAEWSKAYVGLLERAAVPA